MISSNLPKIPIVVVGLNFGHYILDKQLLNGPGSPYFKVAGICDLDHERTREIAAQSGVKAYGSLDEVLEDPSVPAVGLYTSPACRAHLLSKIIRAGKDVMTTKPFELDPKAALAVLQEARDLGRVIHLNSPSPVEPMDLSQISEWRNRYDLGLPVAARADVWASYAEKADGSWMDDPERCPVAPVFRLGIYLINDLISIFGRPEEVQVFSSRLVTGRPTPDNAQLGIRFASGALANIFASFCVRDGDHYRNSMVLNFQNGTVYRNMGPFRSPDADNAVSEMSLVIEKDGNRVLTAQAKAHASGHYRWDLFYRAIKGEEIQGEVNAAHIVDGLKVIIAMAKAQHTGSSVRID
jgi:predicted dehydrogenase